MWNTLIQKQLPEGAILWVWSKSVRPNKYRFATGNTGQLVLADLAPPKQIRNYCLEYQIHDSGYTKTNWIQRKYEDHKRLVHRETVKYEKGGEYTVTHEMLEFQSKIQHRKALHCDAVTSTRNTPECSSNEGLENTESVSKRSRESDNEECTVRKLQCTESIQVTNF